MPTERAALLAVVAALGLLGCSGATGAGAQAARTIAPNGGIVRVASAHDGATTLARVRAAIERRGLRVVAVVDHAANARSANLQLPPTWAILFGNPAAGTPLMQASPSAALDLPQRMAVVTEPGGAVAILYNAPQWLAARHAIGGRDELVARTAAALDAIAREAAAG